LKRLGNEAFKGGHFDEAVRHYSEAINRLDCEGLDDEVGVVRNNRAACWQQLGDHAKVIEDCDAALRVLEGNVKALIRRGLAKESLEMYQVNLSFSLGAPLAAREITVCAGRAR